MSEPPLDAVRHRRDADSAELVHVRGHVLVDQRDGDPVLLEEGAEALKLLAWRDEDHGVASGRRLPILGALSRCVANLGASKPER